MSQPREIIFKLVVLGEGSVGKISMVLQYCEKKFNDSYIMTIGSNFAVKVVALPTVDVITRLQIWDLAGQNSFIFVRPGFYRGSSGGIFVFDITRRETYDKIRNWVKESQEHLQSVPFLLVGNKLDLRDERVISKREGEKLAQEINAIAYYETSAKTSENLDVAFYKLTAAMLQKSLGITVPDDGRK